MYGFHKPRQAQPRELGFFYQMLGSLAGVWSGGNMCSCICPKSWLFNPVSRKLLPQQKATMSEVKFLQAPLLEERSSLCQGRPFVSQYHLCISAQMLFPCTLTAVSGRMIPARITHICCNHNISHSQKGDCSVLFLCIPLPQPEAVQPTPHPWRDPADTPVAWTCVF